MTSEHHSNAILTSSPVINFNAERTETTTTGFGISTLNSTDNSTDNSKEIIDSLTYILIPAAVATSIAVVAICVVSVVTLIKKAAHRSHGTEYEDILPNRSVKKATYTDILINSGDQPDSNTPSRSTSEGTNVVDLMNVDMSRPIANIPKTCTRAVQTVETSLAFDREKKPSTATYANVNSVFPTPESSRRQNRDRVKDSEFILNKIQTNPYTGSPKLV